MLQLSEMEKVMKQVKLQIMNGGLVKILAHGTFGEGTSEFTKSLATDLGEIKERHKGHHHVHTHVDSKVSVSVGQRS